MTVSIMLVDDSPSSLTILKLLLSKAGIGNIKDYTSPKKALACIQQGNIPSLIVTDFKMPEMNGIQFLEVVSALYPELPAVIVTGDSTGIRSESGKFTVIEKGCSDFFKQLIELIKTYTGDFVEKSPRIEETKRALLRKNN
ncbi:MAG: response regulator [Chitinispirillaceae bacterium]